MSAVFEFNCSLPFTGQAFPRTRFHPEHGRTNGRKFDSSFSALATSPGRRTRRPCHLATVRAYFPRLCLPLSLSLLFSLDFLVHSKRSRAVDCRRRDSVGRTEDKRRKLFSNTETLVVFNAISI